MNNIGWTVSEDSFYDATPLGNKTFVNVIAVHDPAVSRRLTVACHYDSKLFTDAEFIAATDSAVPCALMIDVARALNASLTKVPCCSLTKLTWHFKPYTKGENGIGLTVSEVNILQYLCTVCSCVKKG